MLKKKRRRLQHIRREKKRKLVKKNWKKIEKSKTTAEFREEIRNLGKEKKEQQ